MSDIRTIRVFIASPGDLAVERRAFKNVIEELNDGFADGAGVKFEPLGWEDTLASTGRRSQAVINREIERCDVFILAMHRRWGQAAPDAQPYSSYTEEEFHRAYDRWKQQPPSSHDRAPEIFVFFKHIDPGQMADAGPQLQRVLDFRKQLEESRHVLYHGFANEAEFKAEVNRHLRAFAKGELRKADAPRDKVLLPLDVLAEVRSARAEAERAVKRAEREHQQAAAALLRVEELALELAEQAAKAALDGRVEGARQTFAKATEGTAVLHVLYLAWEFHKRTGDLIAAEQMMERVLAITGRDAWSNNTAAALCNLGSIYLTRGDLDRAEEMLRKSLAIHAKKGTRENMAGTYGNLGIVYLERGDLEQAEKMIGKVLAIEKKLGRREGVANAYCALGSIFMQHDEFERAEKVYRNALAIEEGLERQEGIARMYGNLGAVNLQRGDYDAAEGLIGKALVINEKLGRQEGMANDYGNLGLIYQSRGELDRAEEIFKKAIAIQEKLGLQEGIASDYANLGSLAKERGKLDEARERWTKARDVYAKIGKPRDVKQVQEWLDGLPQGEATK